MGLDTRAIIYLVFSQQYWQFFHMLMKYQTYYINIKNRNNLHWVRYGFYWYFNFYGLHKKKLLIKRCSRGKVSIFRLSFYLLKQNICIHNIYISYAKRRLNLTDYFVFGKVHVRLGFFWYFKKYGNNQLFCILF